MEGEKKYLAAFGEFPKISGLIWKSLFLRFRSFEKAWKATNAELRTARLPEDRLSELLEYRKNTDPDKVWAKYQKFGIDLIPFTSKKYPALLKEIYHPPFLLYVRGELPEDGIPTLAVVGSRKLTDYGRRITKDITRGVASKGVVIISGLALGLDAEAHVAALEAGGKTIAVLANGLDRICPMTNSDLGREIIKNGALVSERPIGTPPLKQYFPARNRIISGLSLGVLICEAGEHSGTIHTANFALEQNRQMFAIPGPIYNPLSVGPNELLKLGAKAVTKSSDILEDFGIEEG